MISSLIGYFSRMKETGASDLYLTVGFPPSIRIDDRMENLREKPLTHDEIKEIVASVLTARQIREFDGRMEMNVALDMGQYGRFRLNALRQRQVPALVIRQITDKIPNFDQLSLPKIMPRLSTLKRGLVLITGMTGAGKSTSLASMVDYRNTHAQGHIVTIEDPIEYFHEHRRSIVTQREVGVDTESYSVALKNVLRQRPDVIMIGEIRDREVLEQALLVAETGHLCLATLHATTTYQAIDRMLNFFPEENHNQVRLSLSLNLRAIISQRLLPAKKGGVQLACEVMLNEGLIKDLIYEGKINKIREVMEQNLSVGMCTFDQTLFDLFMRDLIAEDVAIAFADVPGDLLIKIKQARLGRSQGGFRNLDVSHIQMSDPDDAHAR
jgi:twitching motility protein PilU